MRVFHNSLDDADMKIVAKKFRKILKPKKGKNKNKPPGEVEQLKSTEANEISLTRKDYRGKKKEKYTCYSILRVLRF
jgi:hypothetical protein